MRGGNTLPLYCMFAFPTYAFMFVEFIYVTYLGASSVDYMFGYTLIYNPSVALEIWFLMLWISLILAIVDKISIR